MGTSDAYVVSAQSAQSMVAFDAAMLALLMLWIGGGVWSLVLV